MRAMSLDVPRAERRAEAAGASPEAPLSYGWVSWPGEEEDTRTLLEVVGEQADPLVGWVHVYPGARSLARAAREVTWAGLAPAGFVGEGAEALAEALGRFAGGGC